MLRRLIVMRHAEAGTARDDHQRPLTLRGQQQAREVAAALLRRGWQPQRVVSSDALRTRQTWEAMAQGFTADIAAQFQHELYLAGRSELFPYCDGLSPQLGCLLVLGHNPGWQQMASELSGVQLGLSPAAAALLELEAASWSEALALDGCWHLNGQLRAHRRGA